MVRLLRLSSLAVIALVCSPLAFAQTTPAPDGSTPAPTVTLSTLAPPASEVTLPDTLTLVAKPAVILRSQSNWEGAYDHLREAFAKAKTATEKAGLKITGHPVAVFVETNDTSFHFDAILPVENVPDQRPADFPLDMRLGTTPAGKAIRFFHQASYDEIDGAYEQITAYLDAKEINVTDAFIEEYLTFGATSDSATTEVNIYVQPKN